MILRIGRKNFNIMALDIESHNDEVSLEMQETSCWLGCLIDENSKVTDDASYFYSIEMMLDRLEEMSRPKRKAKGTRLCSSYCIYIYNLSFEWSFILPKILLDRGFRFKEVIESISS